MREQKMNGSHIHKESHLFCFPLNMKEKTIMEKYIIFIDENTMTFDELEDLYNESKDD